VTLDHPRSPEPRSLEESPGQRAGGPGEIQRARPNPRRRLGRGASAVDPRPLSRNVTKVGTLIGARGSTERSAAGADQVLCARSMPTRCL
jgi:hypothetical protein